MILLQVIPNLRRSLNSRLTSYYTNRIIKQCLKPYSKQEAATFSYVDKGVRKISAQSNKINDVNINESRDAKIDWFKQDFEQYDSTIPDSQDSTVSEKYFERVYPQPLTNLLAIYDVIYNELHKKCISFVYQDLKRPPGKRIKCTIDVTWPYQKSFSNFASNKRQAARNAALMCLNWLYDQNKIDGLKPVLYEYKDMKTILKTQNSVPINLETELKDEIQSMIDRFDNEIKYKISEPCTIEDNESEAVEDDTLLNVKSASSGSFRMHNNQLSKTVRRRIHEDTDLPIFNYREELLNSLRNNQVVLIKGDTGCGKSTQVPQFIIDEYAKENKAHECNIIISEPRRVSAISLAHRVASERGETLGNTVGYSVRFDKVLPQAHGSLLFCTTGILLRRLEHDLQLEGITHIIIDEAHERSLQSDILLKLFKDMLKRSPHMKLIIMSATINAELFQQYFSCAIVDVPGKLYPVKMHFMEDIESLNIRLLNRNNLAETEVPYRSIVNLIRWIVTKKPHGAILCFLPGWQEIKELHRLLQSTELDNLLLLPLHSKVANKLQQRVFVPAPTGVAKIILATDIAETGITIKDISYVIDTAIKREIKWNENKSVCSLNLTRVSRANISQRKGRAGRVRPGESYHFITRDEYDNLDLYPEAEIFKVPLESAVITSKKFSYEKANDFFNSMVESPNKTALSYATENLKNLGILDNDENLTSLGKRISCFTLGPKLSKAIILSSIFQCLDPIMSIATVYSTSVNAGVSLDETLSITSAFKEQKLAFHKTSDHIAMLEYFNYLRDNDNEQSLFSTSKVKQGALAINNVRKLYNLYMEDLQHSGIISSAFDLEKANAYANNNEFIRAILFASTNHLIKRNVYGYRKGYFTRNANVLKAENNGNVQLKSDSVNYNRKVWPFDTLTYVHKMEYATRRSCLVSDTSIISPLSVLLFSRGHVRYQKPQKNISAEVEQILLRVENIQNLHFCCDRTTADLLLKFRSTLWDIVDFIIQYEGTDNQQENLQFVKSYKEDLMILLSKMLRKSSNNIDNLDDVNE